MRQSPSLLWDLFCRVVDNHGDLGVCWRLARVLATHGERIRLWVDDPSALAWMAPGADSRSAIRVLRWTHPLARDVLAALAPADVWVEAFGCDLPPEFVVHGCSARPTRPPVWINLEYLSAESYAERMHRLPSPIQDGPAAGWKRWFFYPGFTARTGGLIREPGLFRRQRRFDRARWLACHAIPWQGERLISLFCYRPPVLAAWLDQVAASGPATRLLVTAACPADVIEQCMAAAADSSTLTVQRLPYLSQLEFDALLWACDLNFIRGEDSLVRALWAGKPLVWQPYPQQDGAHAAKLDAFLDWLQAPADLRHWHRAWSGMGQGALPPPALPGWQGCVLPARKRLHAQADLATQLVGFVLETH